MREPWTCARIAGLMGPAQEELAEFVAIRSVADPRQFPVEECAKAAQWVLDKFAGLGFSDVHLERTPDGSDAVVGSQARTRPDAPTVLLYAHYDVQPPLDDRHGGPRPSSSLRWTAAGTAGAPPIARATSSPTCSR